jgi:hypothetical protein
MARSTTTKRIWFYRIVKQLDDGTTRLSPAPDWSNVLDQIDAMGDQAVRPWVGRDVRARVVSRGLTERALQLDVEMSTYPHDADGRPHDPSTQGTLHLHSHAMFFEDDIVGVLAPQGAPTAERVPWLVGLLVPEIRPAALRVLLSAEAAQRLSQAESIWELDIAMERGYAAADDEGGLSALIMHAHEEGATRGVKMVLQYPKQPSLKEATLAKIQEFLNKNSDQVSKAKVKYRPGGGGKARTENLVRAAVTTQIDVPYEGEDSRVITAYNAIGAIKAGYDQLKGEIGTSSTDGLVD